MLIQDRNQNEIHTLFQLRLEFEVERWKCVTRFNGRKIACTRPAMTNEHTNCTNDERKKFPSICCKL